eukprot:g8320.t1
MAVLAEGRQGDEMFDNMFDEEDSMFDKHRYRKPNFDDTFDGDNSMFDVKSAFIRPVKKSRFNRRGFEVRTSLRGSKGVPAVKTEGWRRVSSYGEGKGGNHWYRLPKPSSKLGEAKGSGGPGGRGRDEMFDEDDSIFDQQTRYQDDHIMSDDDILDESSPLDKALAQAAAGAAGQCLQGCSSAGRSASSREFCTSNCYRLKAGLLAEKKNHEEMSPALQKARISAASGVLGSCLRRCSSPGRRSGEQNVCKTNCYGSQAKLLAADEFGSMAEQHDAYHGTQRY